MNQPQLLQIAQAAQLANRYSLIRRENQAKTIRRVLDQPPAAT